MFSHWDGTSDLMYHLRDEMLSLSGLPIELRIKVKTWAYVASGVERNRVLILL